MAVALQPEAAHVDDFAAFDHPGQLTIEEFKKLESRVCYKVSADPDAAMRELKESVGKVAASLAQLSHRFAAVEAKLGIETIETIEDVKPPPPDDDATPES